MVLLAVGSAVDLVVGTVDDTERCLVGIVLRFVVVVAADVGGPLPHELRPFAAAGPEPPHSFVFVYDNHSSTFPDVALFVGTVADAPKRLDRSSPLVEARSRQQHSYGMAVLVVE